MFGFNIKEVDVAEQQQMLSQERDNVHLIDVRSPAEIAQGAIPGADHLPLHLLPLQLDRIPSDKKVVLYCRSGARSAQACAFVSPGQEQRLQPAWRYYRMGSERPGHRLSTISAS